MKKIFLSILIFSIFFTFDNCMSQWVQQSSGTTTGYFNSIHFENDMTGWATGSNAMIKKTTNGGVNWVTQSSSCSFGSFNSVFFVNPLNGWIVGNQYYDSTIILKTTDGGNNWVFINQGGSKIFYCTYFINPSIGWAVGDSGSNGLIYKTTNGGTNWFQQSVALSPTFQSCFFLNVNTGWVGGINTFARTSNGGLSWDTVGLSLVTKGLYFVDPMVGFMAENSSKIYKTTDGGLNWNISCTGTGTIFSVYFINPATGWACGAQGKVYKTTDVGTSWTVQTTPVTSNLNSIFFVTPMIGYATGASGVILKTTNGGESTTFTQTIHRYNINKPILLNQFTLDTISIVTNGAAPGFTQDINVYLDTIVNNYDSELEISLIHLGINDTIVYKVGGNGSNFYRTILNDSAAIPIESGTPPFVGQFKPSRPLSQFNNIPTGGTWILRIYDMAKNLTGVIQSWGITVSYSPTIGIKKIQNIIPDRCMLYQNYPNPFNPSTNIKYQIKNSSFVSLKIYDVLGKEIATLVDENLLPGLYETPFSINSITNYQLPSGIYFYSLYIDGVRMDTKKLVLLK
ncbi:MAG: YCF48-related protein [Ignavibacteriae bacterium]|nr:YCF48-related protein [Ignavibacteriota bacterium]